MTKYQVPKDKFRKEIGKEMTGNPRCVGQWEWVGGKLIRNIEEVRDVICNVEGLILTCV